MTSQNLERGPKVGSYGQRPSTSSCGLGLNTCAPGGDARLFIGKEKQKTQCTSKIHRNTETQFHSMLNPSCAYL